MGFRSASELLAWAYEINSIDEGAQSSLRAASGRRGINPLEGLDKIEVKGWAAQVVCWVSTLPPDERFLVMGRFGPAEQRPTVAFALVGRVATKYGIPAARLAIERWFDPDGEITKIHLANKMRKSVRSADRYFGDVATVLELVNRSVMARTRRRFSDLIDDEEVSYSNAFRRGSVDRKNGAVVI